MKKITTKVIFELAKTEDSVSLQTRNYTAESLGANIANAAKIIIGGGSCPGRDLISSPTFKSLLFV